MAKTGDVLGWLERPEMEKARRWRASETIPQHDENGSATVHHIMSMWQSVAPYLTASPFTIPRCIASRRRCSLMKNAPIAVTCLEGRLPSSLM